MITCGKVLAIHGKTHLCRVFPHFSAFFYPFKIEFCPNCIFIRPIHPTFRTVFDPTKIAQNCYGALRIWPVCCADTGESSSLPFSPVFIRVLPYFSARILCPKDMLAAEAKEVILGQKLGMPDPHLTVMAIIILVILTPLGNRAYSNRIQSNIVVGDAKKRPPLRSGQSRVAFAELSLWKGHNLVVYGYDNMLPTPNASSTARHGTIFL